MSQSTYWKWYSLFGLFFVLAGAVASMVTQLWVLTAIPVGFLFGFFLQKGDLCGSSAFSEVLIMRDGRKLFGLWICIVVSMLGFAAGDVLELVKLNPKPMFWMSYAIGGVIFGVGTVFAGGCVSGCLYKGATGNVNSIMALVAMPVGIALVEYGPVRPFFDWTKTFVVEEPGGKALSLQSLTGLPFWVLALAIFAGTLAVVLWRSRGRKPPISGMTSSPSEGSLVKRVLTRSWRPWQAGVAIGVLALAGYMSSAATGRNYPLGVTHGVLQASVLLTETKIHHVYKVTPKPGPQAKKDAPAQQSEAKGAPGEGPRVAGADGAKAAPAAAMNEVKAPGKATKGKAPSKGKKVVWWLVIIVLSFMVGAFISGKLSGQTRLLPKPPEQTLVALLGGLLVGAGAAIGTGCVIGNIMSGWALLSIGLVIFGICTLLANWATAYFYLMGGSLFETRD